MSDAAEYRQAMSRVGGAVHIVTTDGPAGRAGFTATAVASVSDSPPTLLACLNRASTVHTVFKANGVLCVNTLAAGQQDLARIFGGLAGVHGADRFAHGTWTPLPDGTPALAGALVAFECRLAEVHEVATHSLLIGAVRHIVLGPMGPGLAWFDHAWQRLACSGG